MGDTQPSVAERRAAIESQLADEVSAASPIGQLAARAEALREAREFAASHPEQAAALVPDIAQAVLTVNTDYHGKAREFLLGSYEADIRRDGMAALEELGFDHLVGDEATRLDSVIAAVGAVLETDGETTAHRHALVVLGACAASQPQPTAERLRTRTGESSGLPDYSERVEDVLINTSDADRQIAVLQSLAVIVAQDRLRGLVSGLSPLVLSDPGRVVGEHATEIPDGRTGFLVQGWLHYVTTELFRTSPVDVPALRNMLDIHGTEHHISEREGLLWWLLAEADGTIQDGTDDFATLLRKPAAPAGLIATDGYPNALFDTPSYLTSSDRTLDAADSSVRVTAAKIILQLAETEGVTTETIGSAVEALSEVVAGTEDSSAQRRAASSLATVADVGRCDSAQQSVALEGLCRCVQDRENDRSVRSEAIRSLVAVVDGVSTSSDDLGFVVETLAETTGSDAETSVRIESARSLYEIVRRAGVPPEQRERVHAAITDALTAPEDPDLRLAVAEETILEHTESDDATTDVLADAIRELADLGRDHDPRFYDFQAVWQLVRIAQSESYPTSHTRQAIEALEAVIESNPASSVRTLAAWGTHATAHRPAVTPARLGKATDALNMCTTAADANPLVLLLGTPGLMTMEAAEDLELPAVGDALSLFEETGNQLRTVRRLVDLADTPIAGPRDHDRVRAIITDAARDTHSQLSIPRIIGTIEGLTSLDTATPELVQDGIGIIVDIIDNEEPRFGFAALECLADLAEHDALPATSFESVHDGFLSGLEASRGETSRRISAEGFRRFCRANPGAPSAIEAERCARYSAHLTPTAPVVSRRLLAGFRAVAASDAATLASVQDDVQRLLSDDVPVELQVQALEISSELPNEY